MQLLALLAVSAFNPQLSTAFAQGTAFSYQAVLNDGGNPATGIYDLRFTIYDAVTNGDAVSGVLTNAATPVSNGLFSVTLDFGEGVFTGLGRWLEVDVRTNGGGAFAALVPRQTLLPVPYTVMANTASNLLGTLPAAQLCGTLPASVLSGCSGPVTLTNGGNSFNGSFSGSFFGSGAGLTNVPGSLAWQNVTGTSQQAQPNTGYLANNAAQVTITLPTAPNLGDIMRVSGVGAGGWIIAQNAGQAIQAEQFGAVTTTNWNSLTNWTQTSGPVRCCSIASSSDGSKLAAVWCQSSPPSGGIYTSTNSGVTWTQTSAPNVEWYSIALSSDGSKLAAVVWGGGIYTSTNSGLTWTQTSAPGGSTRWRSIASSADGTKLAAVDWVAGIYTSADSGVTWTQTSAPGEEWASIASSADGSELVAVAWTDLSYNPGSIYISANSGSTWTTTSAPSTNWWSVAMSANGTNLAAGGQGVGFYTSTNSGVTWTQTSSAVYLEFDHCIAFSADGTKLAVGGFGVIYTSTNSGVTWTQTSAPGSGFCIASSADGTKLVAANTRGIYTAQATIQTTTTPGVAGYLTGGQNSAIELQYIGNGQWLPLSHEGTISAY
jgi:hypothetical protein